jgi:GDP-fucose protein O-fucosyltransferase
VRRRLFVPGYYSGFSNNKMSLDIAIVLAHLTDRTLVPYRFRLPRAPVDAPPDCAVEPMLVPDLFDIPVRYSKEFLFKTWISVPGARQCVWAPLVDSVLSFPTTLPLEDVRFQQFRNGRSNFYSLSKQEEDAPDLHIHTQALGHYSYVFYLDEARRRQVIELMKRMRPKRPYLCVADHIAASIGQFNAIHIRRGDFLRNELTKSKITRAVSVSGEEIVSNLAACMNRDDPLVICTDGASSEEIFGPIQQYFREAIFLHRYLRESAMIREMIAQLPRNDDSVMALLTQLVASKARVFAGTLFSTFTALIHRLRGFDNQESRFLYCYNDFGSPLVRFEHCEFLPVDDGPYTWNRIRYPVSPGAYSWMREWPESFGSVPPLFEGEASPKNSAAR